MTTYAIEALHRDEGTIVVFEGWRVALQDGPERPWGEPPLEPDTTTYLIAVDHRMAQDIILDLEGGEKPIIFAEGWQIVGTLA